MRCTAAIVPQQLMDTVRGCEVDICRRGRAVAGTGPDLRRAAGAAVALSRPASPSRRRGHRQPGVLAVSVRGRRQPVRANGSPSVVARARRGRLRLPASLWRGRAWVRLSATADAPAERLRSPRSVAFGSATQVHAARRMSLERAGSRSANRARGACERTASGGSTPDAPVGSRQPRSAAAH